VFGALWDRPHSFRATYNASRARKHALAFYRQFISRGALCFDIGANLGNRTELFLALGARVVAVEPQIECCEELDARFARNTAFVLERKALGPETGAAVLRRTSRPASTISSMSSEWIERVRESGRFREYDWTELEEVVMTTLDDLVERYGTPMFCKIDVEGFEAEVLAGLSRPIPSLSVEFTPEHVDAAERCLAHLDELGAYEYNYSLGESLELSRERWCSREAIVERLRGFGSDVLVFGDVYARLREGA